MEAQLEYPDSASQWYKLGRNPRLFFWWLFHRATTPLRVLPDFLVIGVMKGGTTSFFNYLARHPQVRPPFRKEIKFFDIHYPQGLGWYRAHFPMRFKMKAGMVTGEATPYYIFHPGAPGRVAARLPRARLIVLLRNPVDRAYSHYNHMLRVGREPLSFEAAIAQEAERLEGEEQRILADPHYSTFQHLHYSYLARGRYAEQLEKWFALFPREQILILESEQLYAAPAGCLHQAAAFLGLPAWAGDDFPVYKQGAYEQMPAAVRARLVEYYRPCNQTLYDLLHRKFAWDR